MSFLLVSFLVLQLLSSAASFLVSSRLSAPTSLTRKGGLCMAASGDFPELEKCLAREYSSFFAPLEKKFYEPNVRFIDPLNSFEGIDKYQSNVDMLAGRSGMGVLLFKDASIVMHGTTQTGPRQLETRWTLQVTVKILPWQPRAKFSGISRYTISDKGTVVQQQDFWDSINLKNGKYEPQGFSVGLGDFLGQIRQEVNAEMAAPELPYELLRRAASYEVRRYPETLVAETNYDQRPEGYDRLGSYASGSNVRDEKVSFFSPTLMTISDTEGRRKKVMTWPLNFALPGRTLPDPSTLPEPTIPRVTIKKSPGVVVAVKRFELAATEPNVRGFTGNLQRDVQADGLTPSDAALAGDCTIGQFDALFSLNKRRNEVWVELAVHPWL